VREQGDLAGALESFRAALAASERLAKADATNASWQRNVVISHHSVAGVLQAQGDKAGALASWHKALDVTEARARNEEQEEIKSAGKAGPKTASALGELASRALFAREFKTALAAAERAHALAPDLVWTETNHAHALMFLQRTREARALYLEHKGKMAQRQPWERVIARDFEDLRKAGLTHPMMAEIEKTLGGAPSRQEKRGPGVSAGK
jgi:tetratricopeptide (TPR) repeat protein